jgi:bifunctional non-homologous end joining protein LigD
LLSRKGTDYTSQFPDLAPDLVTLPDCAIDGELVVFDANMLPDFSALSRRSRMSKPASIHDASISHPAAIAAFDLLTLNGKDLRQEPIEARKQTLKRLVAKKSRIQYSKHFKDGQGLFEAAEQSGIEGVIAKRRGSIYRGGPSKDWLKIKTSHGNRIDEERKSWNDH